MNGIQEVGGSIPLSSTKEIKGLAEQLTLFVFGSRRFALIIENFFPEICQEIRLDSRASLQVSRVELTGLLFVVEKQSLELGQAQILSLEKIPSTSKLLTLLTEFLRGTRDMVKNNKSPTTETFHLNPFHVN